MKTAVVTGGAGFLGSHLTDRLLAEGCRVVGVGCNRSQRDSEFAIENVGESADNSG